MSLAEDLRAALIWEPEALRLSPDPASQLFYEAMHLRFRETEIQDPIESGHPLAMAANGLALEYDDREVDAARQYGFLSEEDSPLARLVGLGFLAWVGDGDRAALEKATAVAVQLPESDQVLRRSVFCKLLAIALDIAALDSAQSCLDFALSSIDGPSRLRVLLGDIGYFSLGRGRVIMLEDADRNDGLGAEDHVQSLLGGAARRTIDEAFVDRIRSPWRQWIRFGGRNLNDISAAELQATWMGAAWLVPAARRQLAIQLLSGAAETTKNYELGFAYWFLGNGGDQLDVGNLVEPHLTAASPTEILVHHLRRGQRYGYRSQFLKASSALWPLLSPESFESILSSTSPSDGFGESNDAALLLWTTAAVVSPQQWRTAFLKLADNERLTLLPAMSPAIVRRLPDDVAFALFKLGMRGREERADHRDSIDQVLLTLHLASPNARPLPEGFVDTLSDATVSWLGPQGRNLIGDPMIRARIAGATTSNDRTVESAQRGAVEGYLISPFSVLGGLASMLSTASPAVEDQLISVASSERLPATYRFGALDGILRYVTSHQITGDGRSRLREMQAAVRPSLMDRLPPELLRARQLRILFITGEGTQRWDLAELIRHPDVRVRVEALRALSALKGVEHDLRTAVLGGALYDPAPEVVRSALAIAASGWSAEPVPFRTLVSRRVAQLYAEGTAEDRVAAVRSARAVIDTGTITKELSAVVSGALTDRSWLVRDAADTLREE